MCARNSDVEALTWDETPGRVKLANDIADVLLKAIVLSPTMDVMDFGCGSGLLTLRLQPFVHRITGVDSSQGMLDVLNAKIEKRRYTNVGTQRFDPDRGDVLEGSYHAITSAMTLHHIKEMRPLLTQFYKIMTPSGHLCIADLDPDYGRFHESNEGVFHFGFDRELLGKTLLEVGFEDVVHTTAAEVVKPDSHGEMRNFSVFVMTGAKRNA